MKKFRSVKIITYCVGALLIAALLISLCVKSNVEYDVARKTDDIRSVSFSAPEKIIREDAPLGIGMKYEIDLHEIYHDTKLIYHASHSLSEVYIDGELVYRMRISPDIKTVETIGGGWNVVPLYREDAGKSCTVVFLPAYEEFIEQSPEFLLGSEAEVFTSLVRDDMPEIFIAVLVMIIGILFICFGLIFSLKTKAMLNVLSLGVFALSISLWRFNDLSFAALLSENKHIFIYYVSLTMLMITMIPLLESVKSGFKGKITIVFDVLAFTIALLSIVQVSLQMFNILDLRQMLTLTHITIIVSLVLILLSLIVQLIKPMGKRSFNPAFLVIFGIGTDLLLFYVNNSSAGLMCTLLTILLYVLIEGVRFAASYFEQRNKLIESEIKIAHNEVVLAESRFTTMMSQIRSHFIFNILNAISGMCKYDPEKADRTIVHFARFLRSNIDIMQNDDLVHFHNALHHIEDYIALEQIRYGDKIQFNTDITVDDFMLPPLVMQPVIENSIKHGLVGKPSGGTVTLRTKRDDENIYIIIEDDGIGYDSSMEISEKSIGLQNIRFRLDHMVKGSLETESAVNKGTKTTITIPRKEAEKCG